MLASLKARYPDRIPIIIAGAGTADITDMPTVKTNRLLVPCDMTVGQLKYIVERKLTVTERQCLLLFTSNGSILKQSDLLIDIYAHHDQDQPLMIRYSVENTFG